MRMKIPKSSLRPVLWPPLPELTWALCYLETLLAARVTKAAWAVLEEVDGYTYLMRGIHQTTAELLGQKTFLGVWKWMEGDDLLTATVTTNRAGHIESSLGKEC